MNGNYKMLWMGVVAVLMSLLITCDAKADDFNWYRVAANTTLVADWLQTRSLTASDDYYETNGLLGEQPTQASVNRYFAASILLTNIIGEVLPGDYDNYFYLTIAVVEARVITHNYAIGIRVEF